MRSHGAARKPDTCFWCTLQVTFPRSWATEHTHSQRMCSVRAGVLSSSQHSCCGCAFPVWGPCESVFANPQMPFLQNTMMHVTFTCLGLRLHSPSFSASLGGISFLPGTARAISHSHLCVHAGVYHATAL